MPAGELFIKVNGEWSDAYSTWGVSFDGTSISALMTPPPLKEVLSNDVAGEDGKRVVSIGRRVADRTITLGFNISASDRDTFLSRYSAFCSQVLMAGRIVLKTRYQPGVVYHLDYISCQSFGEYGGMTLGKFALRVSEPNPSDREDHVETPQVESTNE